MMRGKIVKTFTASLVSAAMLASSAVSVMSPISVSAVQLLGQSDFENGELSPWQSIECGTAKQNVSVKDGKLVVEVVNNTGGDGRWDLQIRHRGLRINAGHTYELTCEITADKDGYIYSAITNYKGYDDVWHDLSGEEWEPLKVKAGETYKINTQFKAKINLEEAEWTFQYADNLGNGMPEDTGMPNGSTITFDNLSLECVENDGNCDICKTYTPEEDVTEPGGDVPNVPEAPNETVHEQLLMSDFEDGKLGKWTGMAMVDDMEAQKISVEDGKLKVEVLENTIGEGRWGLQLRHGGLNIKSGYTYRVSGEIMCDKDGYIYSRIGDRNGATDLWNKLSGESFKALKLEAGKVYKFSDTFTAEGSLDDAVLAFEYADNQGYAGNNDTGIPVGAILYLDNLSITRLTEGCDCEICDPSEPGGEVPNVPEAPNETVHEQLLMSDFEDGKLGKWTGMAMVDDMEAQKISVEDGKLKVEVLENTIGEGRWGLQLRHGGLNIKSGYTYRVSGEIMCDKDGYIYSRIGDRNGATDLWNKLSGESFKALKLEAGKVYKFSDTFTAEGSLDDAVLAFEYADNQGYAGNNDTGIPVGAILYLDNLSIVNITGDIPASPNGDGGNCVWGDANCDGSVTMADAAAVFQTLGNSDKYALSEQGAKNADVIDNGKGITAADAIAVQAVSAKLLDSAKFPMTQAEYAQAMK